MPPSSRPVSAPSSAGAPDAGEDGLIKVRDAAEHNLRHVDVDIPRDRVVAFTGVSGSGKSSLAFATLYAEAQQRYLESVAPYARRLIDQGSAPKVGSITGLPPAVALRQQHSGGSTRSTVGTVSRVSNVLRMLYSRAGTYPAGRTPEDLAGTFPRDAAPLDSDSFSPNTAVGACPTCSGLGRLHTVDEAALVGDDSLSIREGAIAAWPGAWQGKNYRDILAELGIDIDAPFHTLPAERREWLLTTDEQPTVTVHPVRDAHRVARTYQGTYMSPRKWVSHTFATSKAAHLRAKAASFMTQELCPACHGKRLKPEALEVTLAGQDIAYATSLPLARLSAFLEQVRGHPDTLALPAGRRQAGHALIASLQDQLGTLVDLGLGYLATARTTSTLSGGELQRLHMATQLRSGLFGVLYVLDEPSAGLHASDTELLLTALRRLRGSGNSVFVVEHNAQVLASADWIVDMGPGAGRHGGRVLHNGPARELGAVRDSVTAQYLAPDAPPAPAPKEPRQPAGQLRLRGVTGNNLRDLDADFPLGTLTAVTGVSGSGKSTLVRRALAETVRGHLHGDGEADRATAQNDEEEDGVPAWALSEDRVTVRSGAGLEHVDRLVVVDQKPIGRTPRSNLATYTGLFDSVRKLYAAQPTARELGYTASRFSFNVPQGRCPHCLGDGVVSVELLFLPTETSPCPVCEGARYNPGTLMVRHRDRTIADVLAMSVEEAQDFLHDVQPAARILDLLADIGLGYLTLGQSATTLSGGEAQRIKLVSELHRAPRGHSLYLLDEPTSGLHPADVDLLVGHLQRLVDEGNTVVVAEHDLRTVAAADWVLDLGPGAGDDGGRIVARGRPRDVAEAGGTATADHLRRYLATRAGSPGGG
ncbi:MULTISPECIES: excinuclease ABC subunit UvrA [Streptomyces]|uniref:excinuclease ABC subunit UvrA n=1 Tax=Streptomyces TaxID=1883 RepID=UPI000F54FE20|nr:excinuclease ABC subunit UvrA [Streptomyces sp. ADI98-12]RPK88105.1 UvrABC system protein A [Streptomyces sp. ADI98-12]